MSGIISLDELKAYLGISDSSSDSQLDSILQDLPDYVELMTGRRFGCLAEVIETHDFAPVIFLDNLDIQSIAWIKEGYSDSHDWENDPSLRTLLPSHYRWSKDTGRILLAPVYLRNRSRYDFGEITVKYSYGQLAIPGGIKLAAKQYAGDAFRNIDGQITSESLGEYRKSYKPSESARDIFDKMARVNA